MSRIDYIFPGYEDARYVETDLSFLLKLQLVTTYDKNLFVLQEEQKKFITPSVLDDGSKRLFVAILGIDCYKDARRRMDLYSASSPYFREQRPPIATITRICAPRNLTGILGAYEL